MKIIVRTLIILFAALIVVAAAVGFAQSSFAAAVHQVCRQKNAALRPYSLPRGTQAALTTPGAR